MQNSQSVEKFPLGGFGAGRPFLIVGNSLARLRGVCSRKVAAAPAPAVAVAGLPVCRQGTVRCGTVRYGTVRHSTVRPSIGQYPPSSACPGGWFWYGKYLAGQPGRLLDQVLISSISKGKAPRHQGTTRGTSGRPRVCTVSGSGRDPLVRSPLELRTRQP